MLCREFDVPPIITNVTQIPNQEASVQGYVVGANMLLYSIQRLKALKLY